MKQRNTRFIYCIVCTLLAWLCWSSMDLLQIGDWSKTANILDAAGYILVALALGFFLTGIRLPK